MNTLYEEYIGKLVKVVWRGMGKRVKLQDASKYLLINTETNKKNFNLKPDIVLREDDKSTMIMDTKWKAVEYNGKTTIRPKDRYQMYAYITNYEEASRVILIYPWLVKKQADPIWELLSHKGTKIEVKTVRLDTYSNTVEDLKKIIYQTTMG